MTHDRFRYWRDKMFDKLASQARQREVDLDDILDNAETINLETGSIIKAISKIKEAYIDLEKAIVASRTKK